MLLIILVLVAISGWIITVLENKIKDKVRHNQFSLDSLDKWQKRK